MILILIILYLLTACNLYQSFCISKGVYITNKLSRKYENIPIANGRIIDSIDMNELYYSWFSSIFNENRVFERVPHTIIEDDKLNHPLIDLDIEYLKRQVILEAQSPPTPRSKPLIAIVRGQGGGKTRCLVELKNALDNDEDVLTLAISFNHLTPFDDLNDDWETGNAGVFSSLSFIARLASAYYEESFRAIVIRMRKSFKETFHKYSADLDGLILLTTFLKFVLDSAKSKTTLVVLVDEVVKFELGIRGIYPKTVDANAILRTAVLTSPIVMDRKVNTALVISSLLRQPLGITQSGRRILPFVLVDNLNTTKVIKDWVASRIYDSLSDKTKRQLELFASTINSNPRMCELAQAEIENCKYLSDYKEISLDVLKTLYENVIARIQGMYTLKLSKILIYNVLYNELTPVDDEVTEAILSSSIYNSLKIIRDKMDIIPKCSFISLYLATEKYSIFRNYMEIILTSIKNYKQAGDVLENFFENVLILRLIAASYRSYHNRDLNIADLLGVNLDGPSKLDSTRQDFLLSEVFISKKAPIKLHDMEYNSYNNPQQFANELMNVEVNSKIPIVVIRPKIVEGSQDAYYIGFVLFQGRRTDKRIVLIELKSKNVINSVSDTTKEQEYLPRNGRKPEGHQYLHILKVLCDACKSEVELDGTSSLTIKGDNAMSRKNFENVFQYVYATTSKGKAFSKWGAIVLVEDDLRLFFSSPFWEIYQTFRSIDFPVKNKFFKVLKYLKR